MASELDVPKFDALMKPTLEALKALGGSASNQEVHDWVADHLRLSDVARSVPHGDRGMTALEYRHPCTSVAWSQGINVLESCLFAT